MTEHHGNWATWTFLWDQAVQRQADRILGAELEDAQVDLMLFVDALRNVLRGAERVLGPTHPTVIEFQSAVPDLVHIRNIYEHFDEYVEGKGRNKAVGPRDWIPRHTRVGDDFYVLKFGTYRLEMQSARHASATPTAATRDGAD